MKKYSSYSISCQNRAELPTIEEAWNTPVVSDWNSKHQPQQKRHPGMAQQGGPKPNHYINGVNGGAAPPPPYPGAVQGPNAKRFKVRIYMSLTVFLFVKCSSIKLIIMSNLVFSPAAQW